MVFSLVGHIHSLWFHAESEEKKLNLKVFFFAKSTYTFEYNFF